MGEYLLNLLISLDVMVAALLGARRGETASAYAYRHAQGGSRTAKLCVGVIDFLFAWQRLEGGHCEHSFLYPKFPPCGPLKESLRERD